MFFQHEPNKTKPKELDPVCRDLCDLYEESTKEMGLLRRILHGNPFLSVNMRRCKHHPLYCDPDDPIKCPYAKYLGKTLMYLYCDVCGKTIRLLDPLSPEADTRISNMSEEKKSVIDLCDECKNKGL